MRQGLVLVCALLLAACQHQLTADDSTVAEVKAVQAARFQAMIDVDVEALESILAPDLVYTHTTGSVDTREQFIDSLVQRNIRYHAIDIEENLVRVAGTWQLIAWQSTRLPPT